MGHNDNKLTVPGRDRQPEPICDTVGRPMLLIERSRDGDVIAKYYKSIDAPSGFDELAAYSDYEAVSGWAEIDTYVDSALELFEDTRDLRAGLVATSIIQYYDDHFPPLPVIAYDDLITLLLKSADPIDHLIAIEAGGKLAALHTATLTQYICSLRLKDAYSDPVATAYAEACDKTDTEIGRMKCLISCYAEQART